MKKFKVLQQYVECNSNVATSHNRRVINSLKELLKSKSGRVQTGLCVKRPHPVSCGVINEIYRDIWTDDVACVLRMLKINYTTGYDVTKTGANGAYVEVRFTEFLKECSNHIYKTILARMVA